MTERLLKLDVSSDIFADAAVVFKGRLLFLSLFGRDSGIQHFLARLTLPSSEGGIRRFEIQAPESANTSQVIGVSVDGAVLQKMTGRLPKPNLFGTLVHCWLHDDELLERRKNACAWVCLPKNEQNLPQPEVWQVVKQLSEIPLLDGWANTLFERYGLDSFVSENCGYGAISAYQITLPEGFSKGVSSLLKQGVLDCSSMTLQ